MAELLDVVNENDEVIGQIDRNDKTAEHIIRMVFVGFYTPDKKLILQRRSKTKKVYPDRLTSTVSGHVESGHTYDETAVKETHEETGVKIDPTKLINLGTRFTGNSMRATYAYPFDGSIDDLVIEEGEGAGFIEMGIEDLDIDRIENPDRYTPFFQGEEATKLIKYVRRDKNHR